MSSLEQRVAQAMKARDEDAPAFDTLFAAARHRAGNRRSRRRAAFAVAAVASFAVLVMSWPQERSTGLVSDDELLGTTSWSPPSDVLLPNRHTNIFDDLPALPESTEPAGETLL